MRIFWLIISSLIWGVGCTPAPTEIYNEYQSRLANVVDKAPATQDVTLQVLETPSLDKPVSKTTISFLELASLDHCKLMNTIAKNNNQLGKVRQPSEQLKYALRFIKQTQSCLADSEQLDPELKAKLNSALDEKRLQLPQYVERMIFHERELAKMSLLSGQEIELEDHKDAMNQSLEALAQLANAYKQIRSSEFDISQLDEPEEFTRSLAKLNNNHFVSRLINSARKQTALNNITTRWLGTIDISNDLCKPGRNHEQANILSNVFNRFYLSQLQAYQSKLANMLHSTSIHLYVLWQSSHELSTLFNVEQQQSYYQQLKASTVEHVKWWQVFYKTCKIQP
ncbi:MULTISPECIES: DUF3080 family protein [Pseudoalteromonas]|uniref:DUF3080 domain-containing protein n=1 Tax=Pseudoalteromonas amylolytica TaxID=1859457 RepID=A0A1S1MX30_9GAMM|nr:MULTISPECIES: DUF3080 family protein [Pseudoalteromonas]OHU88009.1 hypothetical protein BFC16_11480 [Pseudoalteromonas sp. JW3]OHU91449.1 hypothetical protein BET10_11600 [Pseudoalteromonas amylolytica]